jgi:hypothetical protein
VNTRRFDKDRDERAKRVSQEMMGLERAAREAKTARLREARLAQEASASQPGPRESKTDPHKEAHGPEEVEAD